MREEKEPFFDPSRVPAGGSRRRTPAPGPSWPIAGRTPPVCSPSRCSLEKYASARARGAVLYNAFLCKSFNAEQAQLAPSEEPNLMKRPLPGVSRDPGAARRVLLGGRAGELRLPAQGGVSRPQRQVQEGQEREAQRRLQRALRRVLHRRQDGRCHLAQRIRLAHPRRRRTGGCRTRHHRLAGLRELRRVARRLVVPRRGSSTATTPVLLDGLTRHFVALGVQDAHLVRDVVRSKQYRHGNDSGGAR